MGASKERLQTPRDVCGVLESLHCGGLKDMLDGGIVGISLEVIG